MNRDAFLKIKNSPVLQMLTKWFLLFALVASAFIFGIIQPRFFNTNNIMEMLRTSSVVGIMALGGILCWSTGDSDFAIGSRCSLGAAVAGAMMVVCDPSLYPVAIVLAVMAGLLSGWLTGVCVVNIGIPSFIATLGISEVINGFVKIMTNDTTLYSANWGSTFIAMGQGYVFGIIPIPVVIFLVLSVIVMVFLLHTRTGHYIYAIGANKTASLQVGVPVNRIKRLAFTLCGGLSAFAGVILASQINSVKLTMGTDLKMPAIVTTILSAAFLTPGRYNVPGAIVAAVLMTMVQNGVITCGGSFYTKDVIQGVILLVALAFIAVVREDGLPDVTFES